MPEVVDPPEPPKAESGPPFPNNGFFKLVVIVGLTLLIGPPIGGVAAALGLIVKAATLPAPETMPFWEVPLMHGVHLGMGLLILPLLLLPAALFSYSIAGIPALVAGLLFALSERLAPPALDRGQLGALIGLIVGGLAHALEFARFGLEDFLWTEAMIAAGGAPSGYLCGRLFRRMGLTR